MNIENLVKDNLMPELPIKRKRGRPRKEFGSLQDQEDAVILKYLNGEPMTLEETALAIWMAEGRKTEKPISKVGMLAIENRALAKLRAGLKKYGINCLDDVLFLKRNRSNAASKFSEPESED